MLELLRCRNCNSDGRFWLPWDGSARGLCSGIGAHQQLVGDGSRAAWGDLHAASSLLTDVSISDGIRVNLLRPGSIDTPMHHRVRGLFGDDIYDKVLIPRAHTGVRTPG